jgi:hypothetical protein
VSEQTNLITIKANDIIPVFRIGLDDSWVSAEPMVLNKSAEPGTPYETLHVHGIWGDKTPQLLQGVGQIATKLWSDIKTVRMHNASIEQLDQFAHAFGDEAIIVLPNFGGTRYDFCEHTKDELLAMKTSDWSDSDAFDEIEAHIEPQLAEQWDWVFGTTL